MEWALGNDQPCATRFSAGALASTAFVRNTTGLAQDASDRLIAVKLLTEDDDVLLATRNGKAIRFKGTDVREFQSRTSTGVRGVDTLPFPVPANARVASMLPFDELFDRIDVLVTNGGWGGTLTALSHGVPVVIGGGDLDKPEVAGRVAFAGAGVNLRTGTPRASAVGSAVARVRSDTSYRDRAQAIAGELAAAGGAARAAELLAGFARNAAP